jgi:hypothetical protein
MKTLIITPEGLHQIYNILNEYTNIIPTDSIVNAWADGIENGWQETETEVYLEVSQHHSKNHRTELFEIKPNGYLIVEVAA